jgi:hypothetical protein
MPHRKFKKIEFNTEDLTVTQRDQLNKIDEIHLQISNLKNERLIFKDAQNLYGRLLLASVEGDR